MSITTDTLRRTRFRPRLTVLEGRDTPSTLQITFDYRYDSTGFFNDPAKRAILEQVGQEIGSHLDAGTDLSAINPSGGNTWSATTFNPSNTGQQVQVPNLSLGADQIVVFVGGGAGGGGEAGLGGNGGYSASGSSDFLSTLRTRGRSGYAGWGGSIGFDPGVNWYVGTGTPGRSQIDFYTVVSHELGHVLGFGVASQWNSLVSGDRFTGGHAAAANGGAAPRVDTADWGHWVQGTTANGQTASMQPQVAAGTRVPFTALDYAALADIGWEVSGVNSTAPATTVATTPITSAVVSATPTPTPAPTPTAPVLTGIADPLVVSGGNGTYQVYRVVNGQPQAVGGPVTPYPGFTGAVRTAVGDVNGDGVKDIVTAAGPGGAPHVQVFDGRTGQQIRSFFAFETGFNGGVFVATGDFNRDGRDDVVVGPDVTGGPRVRVLSAGDPNAPLADFLGIEDRAFTGGVRVAVGDVNRDGVPDLVAAAGTGGAPRVAIWSGATVGRGGYPQRLVGDFFSYETTIPNGSYVAVADLNNDGFADLVFGAGPGAGARVKAVSGKDLMTKGSAASIASPLLDYFVDTSTSYNGGVRVAAGDYDGDGRQDIAVGTGGGQAGRLYLDMIDGVHGLAPFGGGVLSDGIYVG